MIKEKNVRKRTCEGRLDREGKREGVTEDKWKKETEGKKGKERKRGGGLIYRDKKLSDKLPLCER